MRLGKYHGLGNDFLVALAAHNPGLAVDPTVASALCDRKRGIGADGLIYGFDPRGSANDACMVLLNSDGSRAEISGNGIRCLAQALVRDAEPPATDTGAPEHPGDAPPRVLRIETDRGVREVRGAGGDPGGCAWFTVDMGDPGDGPPMSDVPTSVGAIRAATLDLGNPHLVLEVADPGAVDLAREGPALEAAYTDGMNVHFVAAVDPHHLALRVWERGAGATEACGSGAAAAVVAADRWGIVDAATAPVVVTMPGGSASVELHGGRPVLRGPSQFVAEVITP